MFVFLNAQAQPQPEPLRVQQVRRSIYQVQGGSGANTGFFVGKSEVLVIDAKMTEESAKAMIAEIGKVTQNPVRRILLTHSDRDHVNGLPGFPGGLSIIAHEETRRLMDQAFQEYPLRSYLPDITFSERLSLYVDSTRLELLYFGPAHTCGDIVVYFPAEKLVFVGDVLFIGRDPLIHLAKNGSSFGLVKVLKSILELDADLYLSGHADAAGRADLEALIQSLEEKQAKVKALADQGRTLEEVKAACGVEPGGRWMSLYEVIYRELTEKK
ncbi:MBL fold metallo-hydrolase [bacterium]|nr:MBL fold metallo-hydrolase [bacterium]